MIWDGFEKCKGLLWKSFGPGFSVVRGFWSGHFAEISMLYLRTGIHCSEIHFALIAFVDIFVNFNILNVCFDCINVDMSGLISFHLSYA